MFANVPGEVIEIYETVSPLPSVNPVHRFFGCPFLLGECFEGQVELREVEGVIFGFDGETLRPLCQSLGCWRPPFPFGHPQHNPQGSNQPHSSTLFAGAGEMASAPTYAQLDNLLANKHLNLEELIYHGNHLPAW